MRERPDILAGGLDFMDEAARKKWFEKAANSGRRENPKHASGVEKVPFSCVPVPPLGWAALALLDGALKYGRHNWRHGDPLLASDYRDSTQRHMDAWWEGLDTDPKSKLPVLAHAIAGLLVIFDAILQGNFEDDRPPHSPKPWQDELNQRAKELMAEHPTPKPPVMEKDHG